MNICIRPMTAGDWTAVADIYRQGIATGNATFEQQVPAWENWDKGHLPQCRIVAEMVGVIAGWSALSAVSSREVYAGVAEVSVYVVPEFRGQKVGYRLLAALIEASEAAGIWTLQAGIFPENTESLRMHESLGFRTVGRREKIGKMKGQWRDTLLMERRSTMAGTY